MNNYVERREDTQVCPHFPGPASHIASSMSPEMSRVSTPAL